MNRVTNGAARPARRPQSDWKQTATTSEATIPPTIVQPAIASAESLKPPSSTSVSNRCHQRWPPTVRCAVSASIAATSARRRRDSSSLGTVTYADMRRLSERLRTSMAEKIANATSARIETTTKIISHGDVMTSSTQLCSNVPCGVKSSAGVV